MQTIGKIFAEGGIFLVKKAKTEYIADALNELEDAFVVEAATYRSDRSQKRWYRMTFAAACAAVCVILCGIHVWDQDRGKQKQMK